MNRLTRAAFVSLCAIAAPIGAMAQDTSTQGATESPAAPALPLGEKVVDGVTVGAVYTKDTFDDWTMRCVRTEDKKDPCQLYQMMQDDQGNSVAEINLFPLTDGGPAEAGATIVTPLETLLTEQVTLSVDKGATKRYPFSYCSTQGCFARIGLTKEDLVSMRKGASATITVVPVAAPDQKVTVSMSLKGFTKGYEAVAEANKIASGQ